MRNPHWILLALFAFWINILRAAGIPEPGVLMYGVLVDANGARLTAGNLRWTIHPSDNSQDIVITNELADINGQFSFVMQISGESPVPNFITSTGVLKLLPTAPITYTVTAISLDGQPLSFAPNAIRSVMYSAQNRGALIRTDLQSAEVPLDTQKNGIPDAWEMRFFGRLLAAGENALDPDGDGVNTGQEYLAGTDPTDAGSHLFITITRDTTGLVKLSWRGPPGKEYVVVSAPTLSPNVADYTPIAGSIVVNGETRTFTEQNSLSAHNTFYLIKSKP